MTQKKIVGKISEIAAKNGLDADFEWQWSNVGQVYFRKDFHTVANASLNFDSDRLAVALRKGGSLAEFFGAHDKIQLFSYGDGPAIMHFFELLNNFIKN